MRRQRTDTPPMTFRQRVENYWYYYKVHTIVAIAMALVGWYIWSTSRPSGPPTALSVDVIGGAYIDSQSGLTTFEKSAAVAVFGRQEAQHKGIRVNVVPVAGELSSPNNAQAMMGIVAQLSAGALDVLLLDPADFHFFSKSHSLQNLQSLPGFPAIATESGLDNPYGLAVSASSKLRGFALPKGSVVVIVANSSHKEAAMAFLHWLYKSP